MFYYSPTRTEIKTFVIESYSLVLIFQSRFHYCIGFACYTIELKFSQ